MEFSKLFKTNDDERYKNSTTQTSLVTVHTISSDKVVM